MGQYINQNSKGQLIGTSYHQKIINLIEDGATRVSGDQYLPNMIAVIDNGMFAAAGYMYNEKEYEYFRDNTSDRSYTWLIHPKAAELVD